METKENNILRQLNGHADIKIPKTVQDATTLYNPKILFEDSSAYDDLQNNGMMVRGEKHIVAIEHDPIKCADRLKQLQKANPLQDYRVTNGFIESVHYYPMSGSNADLYTYPDDDEIAECARMIGMVPCPVDFAKSERC